MSGDKRGPISLRNSVFDCNWQSKMLLFLLIDLRSSTVIGVLIADKLALETAFSISSGNRKRCFSDFFYTRSSTFTSVYDGRLSG